tara:strand:+ start:308 stop:475 length:168 start_codon:yes stop_codon:yes gene_type:complete
MAATLADNRVLKILVYISGKKNEKMQIIVFTEIRIITAKTAALAKLVDILIPVSS